MFGNWGERIALPLLGSPQPLRSGRKGAAYNPLRAGPGLPDAPGRDWRGSQRLALQRDDGTAAQLLCQCAAVLDLLVAICL